MTSPSRSYTVQAHPTTYAGVRFRSRLEARWAAFFDYAGWAWDYEPLDLAGWSPDFAITAPALLVEVKPYHTLEAFADHPAWSMLGHYTPAPACFGVSPVVTRWVAEGVPHTIPQVLPTWDRLWKEAGNAVQWRPRPAHP